MLGVVIRVLCLEFGGRCRVGDILERDPGVSGG